MSIQSKSDIAIAPHYFAFIFLISRFRSFFLISYFALNRAIHEQSMRRKNFKVHPIEMFTINKPYQIFRYFATTLRQRSHMSNCAKSMDYISILHVLKTIRQSFTLQRWVRFFTSQSPKQNHESRNADTFQILSTPSEQRAARGNTYVYGSR